MCQQPRKVEAYETTLLEIAALGNDPKRRVMYAVPIRMAERALDAYRRPADLNLLAIDLAAGERVETVEEEIERRR